MENITCRLKEEPVHIFVDELADSAVILGGWDLGSGGQVLGVPVGGNRERKTGI